MRVFRPLAVVVATLLALALHDSTALAAPGETWSGVVQVHMVWDSRADPNSTGFRETRQFTTYLRQAPGDDDFPQYQPYEWTENFSFEGDNGCHSAGSGRGFSPAVGGPGVFDFRFESLGDRPYIEVGRDPNDERDGRPELMYDVVGSCGIDEVHVWETFLWHALPPGPVPAETQGDGIENPDDRVPDEYGGERWTWRLTSLPDRDNDGTSDAKDNCPDVFNWEQYDEDSDGVGDACDTKAQCEDGIDNDGDGFTDGFDPGCESVSDDDESNPAFECSDGLDNDGDGYTDFPEDPTCTSADGLREGAPACSDGIDNDGDGKVDYPGDPGCAGPDDDELDPPAGCPGAGNRGFFSQTYRAIHPVPLLPDAEFFRFEPRVRFCYDGQKGVVLQAYTSGEVDYGVDTAILELLGFDLDYDPTEERIVNLGDAAIIRGDFEFRFDWATLLSLRVGKVGIKKKVVDPLEEKLKTLIARRIGELGQRRGVARAWEQATFEVSSTVQRVMVKWTLQLKRYLPDAVVTDLSKFVRMRINDKMDGWRQKQLVGTRPEDFAGETAKTIVDTLFKRLASELDKNLALHFSVWSPEVTVRVSPNGTTFSTALGYVNPFVFISNDKPEIQHPPRLAASRTLEAAAGALDLQDLRDGQAIRALGGPGTTKIEIFSPGGGGAAAAGRRMIARGQKRFTRRKWAAIRVKPTKPGRRVLRRARRRLNVVVRVTVQAGGRRVNGGTQKLTLR